MGGASPFKTWGSNGDQGHGYELGGLYPHHTTCITWVTALGFAGFAGVSYLQRHDILCQKLARGRLYCSAAVIATLRTALADGAYTELSPMTGLRSFVATLAGTWRQKQRGGRRLRSNAHHPGRLVLKDGAASQHPPHPP